MARRGGIRPGKKLKDAAAYWARGGPTDEEARADLRSFGAAEDDIERMLGPKEEGFEVWPENWPAWEAFSAVQTQWVTGMAGITSLDYSRVRDGLRLAGIRPTKELFSKLRIIEATVLETLAAERKKSESRKR